MNFFFLSCEPHFTVLRTRGHDGSNHYSFLNGPVLRNELRSDTLTSASMEIFLSAHYGC